jgi:uncharacterized protein
MAPGKLLRIFLAGDSKVYEGIVEKCREMHIAGATVLRGDVGFGSGPEIQGRPIEVAIVDEAAKIVELAPVLEAMLPGGALVISDVQMRRVGG